MKPLIEIRGLLVRRERQMVLEIPALDVERGAVTALVGPNGAGKSTLLLVLARLLKPEQGQIVFDNQSFETLPDLAYRRQIGLVMQDSLLLNRSVFDNIALGLKFRRLPRVELAHRVDEWLEKLSIQHLRRRRATSLSGGEAQRVSLARALVLQPSLLLLDEPFKSLDDTAHTTLLADLKNILPKAGTTVLFSTHSPRDVRELADRKIALKNGKVAE